MKLGPLLHDGNVPPAGSKPAPIRRDYEGPKAVPEEPAGKAQEPEGALPSPKIPEPIVNGLGLTLEFVKDKLTDQTVIRVYDKESGNLVRQIPPEEVMNFLRQFAKDKGSLLSLRL